MSEGYEKKKNGGRRRDFDRLFVFGSDLVFKEGKVTIHEEGSMMVIPCLNSLVHTVQRKIQICNFKYKYIDRCTWL